MPLSFCLISAIPQIHTFRLAAMSTPLNLPPELLSTIGSLLSKTSLLACIQVSRSWNRTLLPSLWREINLNSPYDIENLSLIEKTQDQLKNHADMVRSLAINMYSEDTVFGYLSKLHFPHLQTLFLEIFLIDSEQNDSAALARDFIQRHSRHLKSSHVHVMYEEVMMPLMRAWKLLSGCLGPVNRLTSLDLSWVHLALDEMDEQSRLMLLGLRSLKLSYVFFTRESRHPTLQGPPPPWSNGLTGCRVQHLSLQDCDTVDDVYQLLDDCREIKSLEFGWDYSALLEFGCDDAPSLEKGRRMISQLRAGMWPFLESLTLILRLEDSELVQILEAINPLKHWSWRSRRSGPCLQLRCWKLAKESTLGHWRRSRCLVVQSWRDRWCNGFCARCPV